MKLLQLDATQFKSMILSGADKLAKNVDLINSLNVFPVPDGDTGTNMNMTFSSGADYVRQSQATHVGDLSKALAKGLLMGARGNSGVILSQIFRGFSQSISHLEYLTAETFAAAFIGGVESAYKAVMKPVEGTILTVAREAALAGEAAATETDDIVTVLKAIIDEAHASLKRTPDLLPVLKQVGVVDSGGKGLVCIYEGFLANIKGETILPLEEMTTNHKHIHAVYDESNEHPMTMDDITFGYCTEIMVRLGENPTSQRVFDYEVFREDLNQLGDSLLVIADDEIVKVHIHTEDPGQVMRLGQQYGELIKIKVDNMREQVRELASDESISNANNQTEGKSIAVISVATGAGMTQLLQEMGVDYVLAGGQTMNPSTQDFVDAMEQIQAESYLLLPNNKNIVMAAEQAASISAVPAHVIKTTSIPQGFQALLGYNPDASLDENTQAMEALIPTVKTGQITTAIRDTDIDGVTIKKDDFMGLIDGDIAISVPSVEDALSQTIMKMLDEDSEVLTIYIGESGDETQVKHVVSELTKQQPDMDIEVLQGDQPVYPYIIAVE